MICLCSAALEAWKLQCACCVMHYSSVTMVTCNLHCASYMWYCTVASVTCNLHCGNSIMCYCCATLTTCNLHCADYIIWYSTWNWWTAFCTVQVVLYTSAFQLWRLEICVVEGTLQVTALQNRWTAFCSMEMLLCVITVQPWQLAICTVHITLYGIQYGTGEL